MKDEYIIINKTTILKRIEELEKVEQELISLNRQHSTTRGKIDELISLLSQSTPLIPKLEEAFGLGAANHANGQPLLSEYISNLKLDI